jgi:hypothetical protein
MMQFEREVTTTVAGRTKKTRLTVVNDSQAAWDALAIRSAVVAVQARWRSAGEVPDADTVKVTELVGRRGRPAIDPVKRAKADPAYRARLIAELMELGDEDGEGGEE